MTYNSGDDSKSVRSYRSTHSTRSSVLERAREYNHRLNQQKTSRSKSLERQEQEPSEVSAASGTPRSQSVGRMSSESGQQNHHQGNRPATRERAMASIQRESMGMNRHINTGNNDTTPINNNNNNNTMATEERRSSNGSHNAAASSGRRASSGQRSSPINVDAAQGTPRSRASASSAHSSHVSRPKPTTPRMSDTPSSDPYNVGRSSSRSSYGSGYPQQQQPPQQNHQQQQPTPTANRRNQAPTPRESPNRSRMAQQQQPTPTTATTATHNNNEEPQQHEAVVTPELLVDALSGHEDGLLAIAERLMEHYDSGYDVMGEAIIDAFADVQKLFQHVVEAAHMEGAAFESSRREEEMAELRQRAAAGDLANSAIQSPSNQSNNNSNANGGGANNGQPTRHDEFIDQDVKDILSEAIRNGATFRNSGRFTDCFKMYEAACQNSSAMLPVDSDHRGRLQLSIARAESMSHERACAILRYAMDDLLRSGIRPGQTVTLPDPSQRADVVLNRNQPSVSGLAGHQSSEEALNSLVEEMREVMNAPVYNNTPLQSVAQRFLSALNDAQKAQSKNEEKLEQNLAKLKGDFLLARAEWEEKLNSSQETAEVFKTKYSKLKQSMGMNNGGASTGDRSVAAGDNASITYLEHARSALASQQQRMNTSLSGGAGGGDEDRSTHGAGGYSSIRASAPRAGSQVSLGSGLANHARSIVGSFACAGGNPRSGGVVAHEMAENRDAEIREMAFRHDSGMRDRDRRRTDKRNSGAGSGAEGHGNISMSYSDRSFNTSDTQSQSTAGQRRTPHSVASGSTRSKSSRSFREYSRSPQRVDF